MRWRLAGLVVLLALSASIGWPAATSVVGAATAAPGAAAPRGLLITPTQDDIKTDAGKPTKKTLVVANLTEQTITVNLSIKEFSVANYTYDYTFTNPHRDWIKLGLTEVTLTPGKSQTIPYTITPAASAGPGGYYYTLFASSQLSNGGLTSTVQAASLLFVTVNGDLVQTGRLEHVSVQRVVFSNHINYHLDALNTGNVYYAASVAGQLHGFTVKAPASPISHVLIPGKIRTLNGAIDSPVLPGIYKATFGYVTDSGSRVIESRWILYLPFWFLAILVGLILFWRGWRGKRKRRPTNTPADAADVTSGLDEVE